MKNKTLQNFLIFSIIAVGSYATYKIIIRPAIKKLRTKKLTNFGNTDTQDIIINSNSQDLT